MKRVLYAVTFFNLGLAGFNGVWFAVHGHIISLVAVAISSGAAAFNWRSARRYQRPAVPAAGLDGPSRTIIVEPVEVPTIEPAPTETPERAPEPTPEREPEKVPA